MIRIANILFNQKKHAEDKRIAGVEKSFIDYSKIFVLKGCPVLSVFKQDMPYKNLILDNGSEVYELNPSGHADIISISKLFLKLRMFKPDIIFCHSGRALFMARSATFLNKVPVIAVNHGSNIKKFLKADYIFTVNSFFANKLIEAGKNPSCSKVVPNMLEIPPGLKPTRNLNPNSPIKLGSIGRLAGEKCYAEAIKTLPFLKEQGFQVELLLAGEGDQRQPLEELAKRLGLEKNVKFLGWVDNKQEFFRQIDIFILPSLVETFGIALLEAMLYNVPIIASNSWGPSDIIQDGTDGLLISKDNLEAMPKLLAEAVIKLVNNPLYAKQLAANAYQKLQNHYSFEVVGNSIVELVKNIVSKSNPKYDQRKR